MKKNNLIIFIIIIIIILLGIGMISYLSVYKSKAQKAKEIFGEETCEAILHMATKDLVNHTCELCQKEFQDSSMHASICLECAKETNRCDFCGKIQNK